MQPVFDLKTAPAAAFSLAAAGGAKSMALPEAKRAGSGAMALVKPGRAGGMPFGRVLSNKLSEPSVDNSPENDAAATEKRSQAEKAAAGLVSAALILPVLKQLRRSPWGEKGPFSAGIGEKSFGPQFDMQLADQIANSPRLGAKQVLADRFMKRGTEMKRPAAVTGIDVHG